VIAALENVAVFCPSDDHLDLRNLKPWKREINRLIRPGARVVLDLSQVRHVDSAACGALLAAYRGLLDVGGELKLCAVARPVRALFELVRLHRVFEVYNTREEALRAFDV
jgi:anti-sigma B factor antagonist